MELELRGHDYRYAVEQALMAYLPEESAACRLVSTLNGDTAEALLTVDGVTVSGTSRLREALPAEELLRNRALQKLTKESVFAAAVALNGKVPPWGSLTGVRPGKLAARRLRGNGRDKIEAAAWLQEEYSLSPVRASLCADAALVGLETADLLAENDIILYVGIPFCPTRCAYCSFVSHSVEKSLKLVEPYVEALCGEMASAGALCREAGLRVRAVYWGGGTPTTLSEEQLRRTLGTLEASFDLSANLEYTVEAGRPDTITREKLLALRDYGVGRISINPQTMEDSVLQAIGRRHSAQQIRDGYALARDTFDTQVNMDLIAGLPADSVEGFKRTLDEVLSLAPENVTVHTLTRKRGADLNSMELRGLDGETVGQMLDYSLSVLPENGYFPYYLYRQKFSAGGYENVGWSKPGAVCRYNVAMMEELCSVLSLGAGGATKRMLPGGKILRCFNQKYPYEYIGARDAADAEKRALFLKEAK